MNTQFTFVYRKTGRCLVFFDVFRIMEKIYFVTFFVDE